MAHILPLAMTVATMCQSWGCPVKVSVYYEVLCPDSQRFITTQLYPVWLELKGIMVLDINAHGKATYSPDGPGFNFTCQHGPRECDGNMMLTCAHQHIAHQDQFMAYVNCVMERLSAADQGAACAAEVGVEFQPIQTCYSTLEGQLLQHKVALKQDTLQPSLNYVPWILINDNFSDGQLQEAQRDLKKVVCEAYQGAKPSQCYV